MHISELDTPALLIDRAVMLRNIRRAQEQCSAHGIALRPHMKTHKLPPVARLQVEAGAVGLTCAKIGEAEVMADGGIDDLMVAYPIWGAAKLERLIRLAERVRLSVAFDSETVAAGIARAAREARATVGALVEVDTGTGRCGLPPGEALLELCRWVADQPGLEFRGIMTYQGYLQGPEPQRIEGLNAESERIEGIVASLAAAGLRCEVVSGASTPNLFLCHLLKGVNENRCGTYVFNDGNTVRSGAVNWDDCAARVAVTVVSTAVSGQVIIDGGAKTFSGDGGSRVIEDPGATLVKMNEEHGYLKLSAADPARRHRVGDRLHIVPTHVCTCVNMHDRVWVHDGGQVVDCWEVAARGKLR
jgi:D-serine deaminase-like pyridoxal phosphate-dependent protein